MRFYSCYAFDLDGTLYRGTEVVPGAPEALRALREKGAKILFLTNNSGLTKADYVAKLTKLGFEAVGEEVVTSAQAAADYCAENGLRRVGVVGEPGLVQTLRDTGIEVANADDSGLVKAGDERVDALVSGICREALSYRLLDYAMQIAMRTGTYIACNKDLTYPVEDGKFSPGSGAIVAAIEACSAVTPILVGKPKPAMLLVALGKAGIDPEETLLVGDRMDTDIECGKAAGCDTALVLTGVTQTAVDGQFWVTSVTDLV